MNLEVFSNNIQNIGKLRHGIDEFHKLANEIRKEEESVKALENHIANCNGIKTELDMERRNHAEELRQINQDINSLEDITKSTKSEVEKRKRTITVAMGVVDRMRGFINENLESMNIGHKLETSEEEQLFKQTFERQLSDQAPPSHPMMMPDMPRVPSDLPVFLQSLLNCAQQQQPPGTMTNLPRNMINRHRMPPSFVEASKMKASSL
uniref:C4H2-type domain-containing protein n=1 Tax=Caenorhabditis tropicalis TaxID=1561998 RepID=A0A1I7UCA9_9PELO